MKGTAIETSSTTHKLVFAYESEPKVTRMGKFCLPVSQEVKQRLIEDSQLFQRRGFLMSWDSIKFAGWLGINLGIVYMLMVQFFPIFMNLVGVIGGGVTSVVLGILLMAYSYDSFAYTPKGRATLATISIVIGLYLLVFSRIKSRQLKLNSVFLNHSSQMVSINWPIVFFIPLFLAGVAGLSVLCLF